MLVFYKFEFTGFQAKLFFAFALEYLKGFNLVEKDCGFNKSGKYDLKPKTELTQKIASVAILKILQLTFIVKFGNNPTLPR